MKNIIIFLIIITSSLTIRAQKFNIQPGIFGGVAYYMGDVNHSKLFYSPKAAFGIILKHVINEHYELRLDINQVSFSGNDADFNNGYQQARNHSFSNKIYEISFKPEFNFLEFTAGRKREFTTFITAGIGMFIAPQAPQMFNVSIPIGVGFKYSFSKRLTLGAEWGYRNTFTDKLDLLPDNNYLPSENLSAMKQITNDNSTDWYSVAGVFLTYNFKSSKKWCPAYSK